MISKILSHSQCLNVFRFFSHLIVSSADLYCHGKQFEKVEIKKQNENHIFENQFKTIIPEHTFQTVNKYSPYFEHSAS